MTFRLSLPDTIPVPMPRSVGREPVAYGEGHQTDFSVQPEKFPKEIAQRIFVEGLKKVLAVRVGPVLDKAQDSGEEISPELLHSAFEAAYTRLANGEWRELAIGRVVDPRARWLREQATEMAKSQIRAGKVKHPQTGQPYTKLDHKLVTAVRDQILTSDIPKVRQWREATLAAYRPPEAADLGDLSGDLEAAA